MSFFSLDFSGQYLRRAIARDVFSAGSIDGYIASIGTQAFFPVLFAWGVYKKSNFFFWLGVVNVLILWGAFGQKYPFVVLFLVYVLMTYFRYYGKVNVSWLLFGAIGLLLAGFLEFELMGYSYLNDYLIRRAYTVPATMLGAAELFYDSYGINNYSDTAIGLLSGFSKSESITFRIGEYIYNNSETNANVNFFAVAYLRLGYTAVIIEAFIVAVIVMLLNLLYMKRSMFIAMPVALLFVTKIVEQSLPTVLLGSGIFFMLLLLMLMAFSRESKSRTRSIA
ncbi:polymerase [Pseudomonas fluorescens]|uniref:Polymerase n=2 Tax=Pseudomonas TaxID=286 RepID=A0A0N9WQG3_PSEFL|nr:polymerase [Pseudomonas fluorescens]POA14166.1 polymerase [Pseudomonas sp. MPBD7-1]